ncbi:MAG TPA: trypsin-like serine protease [Kofleriaceae bacterium]|nr:trypsin-like serine protease [Kofleriaceae bacterium]
MGKHLALGAMTWVVWTGCAQEPSVGTDQATILGGTAASVGQYPTVVAVVNNGLCSGTLIDKDWVLTAAHCVDPQVVGFSSQEQVTANTAVLLDTVNVFANSGRQIRAADTIPNPGFSINALGDDDIALVKLSSSVTDRDPTPINRIAGDAPPGILVDQVGFGMTDTSDQNSAGQLYALLDKASRSCSQFEGSNANLLCYGQTDGTGKCEGDSGGPSFITVDGVERVAGVTSFGDQNCTQFGADTRVDAETAFLFEHVPALQCQADGICNQTCTGTLPVDPDCPVCDSDDDCGTDMVCQSGQCTPAPFTPGGLGSECATSTDCDSGLCAVQGEDSQCTDTCTPGGNECPDGFDCLDAGVCWGAQGGGGCRTTRGHGAPVMITALGLLLVLARRRRR